MEKNRLQAWRGLLYLFCAFALAGTSVISARFVEGKLGNFTITSVSLLFALAFIIPVCGKKLPDALRALRAKDWLLMALQAVCGIFLFRLFLLNGLAQTSAGEAGILTGATPAITAVLAVILLKERVCVKKLLGIVATVFGILLIQGLLSPGSGFNAGHFWGNMLVLCAAACESVFNIISRAFAVNTAEEKSAVHPAVQTAIVCAIAFLLCLIPAILFEQPAGRLAQIGAVEWTALVWWGVFVTACAFIAWYAGINRSGALTAAAFSGMMPCTAMLLSIAVLGEHPGWQQWAGAACIAAGMALIGSGGTTTKVRVHIQKTETEGQVKENA